MLTSLNADQSQSLGVRARQYAGWQACGSGKSLNNKSSFHAADGQLKFGFCQKTHATEVLPIFKQADYC
jgi:hypothetical protein